MKILWITNTLFPEAKELLTGEVNAKGKGEGWLIGSANELIKDPDIKLVVVSVSRDVSKLTKLNGHLITYYIIPMQKDDATYDIIYEGFWREIIVEFSPDITHIQGTEYPHGLAYLNVFGSENVVASIQGMTSVYANYYLSGLSLRDLIESISFHDIVMRSTLFNERMKMKRRGKIEIEILKKLKYVIGRTSWDRENVWAVNPNIMYYFCNETLRKNFYQGRWKYSACNPHTIFVPQANYPIKGFHMILKSLPLVLEEYPDTTIRVAGYNYPLATTFSAKLRERGYNKILRKYIQKNHLEGIISYLGPLSAEEMKQEYLNANLFLCASSIENSPNSLGEAQMLGVPCLSSYVGGVMDMIPNKDCGEMYRFEELSMLAARICSIFKNSTLFDNTNMINVAKKRHDQQSNLNETLKIYNSITLKL